MGKSSTEQATSMSLPRMFFALALVLIELTSCEKFGEDNELKNYCETGWIDGHNQGTCIPVPDTIWKYDEPNEGLSGPFMYLHGGYEWAACDAGENATMDICICQLHAF